MPLAFMDKKNQIIGIICIICAFVLLFKVDAEKFTNSIAEQKNDVEVIATSNTEVEDIQGAQLVRPIENHLDDKKVILENDFIRVTFSVNYGAIDHIALKKYHKAQDCDDFVTINEGSHMPALGMMVGQPEDQRFLSGFELSYCDDACAIFSKVGKNGVKVIREYNISPIDDATNDAYIIKHSTKFKNTTQSNLHVSNVNFCLGSITATEGDFVGEHLNFGYYDGSSAEFIKSRDFAASRGFFGLGKHERRDYIGDRRPIIWGAIKNQFFTAILTPSSRASGYFTAPIEGTSNNLKTPDDGIFGEMTFKVGDVAPGSEYRLDMDFYAGPKNFTRLDRMAARQDLVMQFGFFGIISKILLLIMMGIHSMVSNWGLSIILLTIIVKLCLWPLTTAQVRASKKMTAIQEPLRELREKYKNNPAKVQTETMRLFKQYRVNPAAGCLPIFIQIPIFFGLYYMLRSSSDLRFAHFLWIKDLSVSDTVAYLYGFPINILPIIMGLTMMLQMHMTPMPSADGSQKMVFKLMPLIFLFCCYNFPSGLVLYWTVQNVLTILQQYIVSKRRDMQVEQVLASDDISPKNSKMVKKANKKFIR
ncbi:MAG: membrane protein insertase YidC [Opitutales bacterium]|nr:membrane protein insertase YidC [Opitutales bacterium]